MAPRHCGGAARAGDRVAVQPSGADGGYCPRRARRGGRHAHRQRQNIVLQPADTGKMLTGPGQPGADAVPAEGAGAGSACRIWGADRALARSGEAVHRHL